MKRVTAVEYVAYSTLNINEKINAKSIYTNKFTSLTRRKDIYTERELVVQFSADEDLIADALESESKVRFYSKGYDGTWEQTDEPGDVTSGYYSMAYLPYSCLWVFYPEYVHALNVQQRRVEEMLEFPTLNSRIVA